MRPGKRKRRQLEQLQREMEEAGERFGLDPIFAPQLVLREKNAQEALQGAIACRVDVKSETD